MTENKFVCDCDVIHVEAVDKVKRMLLDNGAVNNLAELYDLLSSRTRCAICVALLERELCVCDLANILSMSKSAVSHQLRNLREGHLVTCQKVGKEVYYRLDDKHVRRFLVMSLKHIKHYQGKRRKL